MAGASLVSAALAIAAAGRPRAAEVLLGMAAPLTERTYKRDPQALTGMMTAAFAVKMLFFGTYVALMLRVVGLQPLPFVVSFTGYFIALYLTEALLMRRLFAGG